MENKAKEIKETTVKIDVDIVAYWMYKHSKGVDGNMWYILKGPFDSNKIMRQKQAGFKLWVDLTPEEREWVNLYPDGTKKQYCTPNPKYQQMKKDNPQVPDKTLEQILIEKETSKQEEKDNAIAKLMEEVNSLKESIKKKGKKSKKEDN